MSGKFVAFAISFLSLFYSGLLFADIIVDVEGKKQKYPDGSTLNISAAKNMCIDYYGVKVFIPKGEKISLRFSDMDEDNSIFCLGNNFKNVIVGDTKLSTNKNVAFVVNQKGNLKIERGTLVVRDKKDNVAILDQGTSYKIEVSVIPSDFFVPISTTKQEQYEQVEKDIVLSPSAPRN